MPRSRRPRSKMYFQTADVQPGDVVFFHQPGASLDQQVGHVGVCVGDKEGVPQIAHACFRPSLKPSVTIAEIIVSRLTTDFSYWVFRPMNIQLSAAAVKVALQWARFPDRLWRRYDEQRFKAMKKMLNEAPSLDETVKRCVKSFREGAGDFRGLKFAIRVKQPLRPNGKHGLICSQFVTTVFQVAEWQLLSRHAYKEYDNRSDRVWPSLHDRQPALCAQLKQQGQQPGYPLSRYKQAVGYIDRCSSSKPAVPLPFFVTAMGQYLIDDVRRRKERVLPLDAKCFNAPSVMLSYLLIASGGGGAIVPEGVGGAWKLVGLLSTEKQVKVNSPLSSLPAAVAQRFFMLSAVTVRKPRKKEDSSTLQSYSRGSDTLMPQALQQVWNYHLKRVCDRAFISLPPKRRVRHQLLLRGLRWNRRVCFQFLVALFEKERRAQEQPTKRSRKKPRLAVARPAIGR